ncbi:MAG TPA: class I SAM-dependent methyltransferase [Pyrinomonadaceae bacterium]
MRRFFNRGKVEQQGSRQFDILESYVQSAPHPQNALDIFKGEWASQLPDPTLKAGTANLFDDERIVWAESQLGGFVNKVILDLGPLEGGHPYMFERRGAREVVAIESNTRAFLKCLLTKEILRLERVRYLCGDFVEYLRETERHFDLCNASGVLYHMRDPVELIALIARAADQINMWTHYYDEQIVSERTDLLEKFSTLAEPSEYGGFAHTLFRQQYGSSLATENFCGGTAPYSRWMPRDDIIRALEHFGFKEIHVAFEIARHVNGPCFALAASK